MTSNVIKGPFDGMGATLTPAELANILDLAAKAPIQVGVTLQHIAPVWQRAAALASLPEGSRIGALPVAESESNSPPPAAGQQLELPFEQDGITKRRRRAAVLNAPRGGQADGARVVRELGFGA